MRSISKYRECKYFISLGNDRGVFKLVGDRSYQMIMWFDNGGFTNYDRNSPHDFSDGDYNGNKLYFFNERIFELIKEDIRLLGWNQIEFDYIFEEYKGKLYSIKEVVKVYEKNK